MSARVSVATKFQNDQLKDILSEPYTFDSNMKLRWMWETRIELMELKQTSNYTELTEGRPDFGGSAITPPSRVNPETIRLQHSLVIILNQFNLPELLQLFCLRAYTL